MTKQVGTFTVEDAFLITGRGWVLAGGVDGAAWSGNQLSFSNGVLLMISAVNSINVRNNNQLEKAGLLISQPFASRQELLDQNIIGATALILE